MAKFILSAFSDEADESFEGQLTALRAHRIRLMEMRGVDGKSVADLTQDEAKEYKKRLDGAGIRLGAMGSPFGKYPTDKPFEPHLDAFRRGLECCRVLGTDRMRVFSFYYPEGDDPAKWRKETMDRLAQMLAYAKDAGITLCHENEHAIYGDIDARCVDLLTAFGGELRAVFDPANFILDGVNPPAALPAILPYVEYLHIKDACRADRAIVPAGMGDGGVKGILEAVSRARAETVLTIEPHLKVFAGLDKLQGQALNRRFEYATSQDAFSAAVNGLKDLLTALHFSETSEGVWEN